MFSLKWVCKVQIHTPPLPPSDVGDSLVQLCLGLQALGCVLSLDSWSLQRARGRLPVFSPQFTPPASCWPGEIECWADFPWLHFLMGRTAHFVIHDFSFPGATVQICTHSQVKALIPGYKYMTALIPVIHLPISLLHFIGTRKRKTPKPFHIPLRRYSDKMKTK